MAAGWGNISVHRQHAVEVARLNAEIRKRGDKLAQLEQHLGRDWRGRYAQDLATDLLSIIQKPAYERTTASLRTQDEVRAAAARVPVTPRSKGSTKPIEVVDTSGASYLTTPEVAAYLRVSVATVHQWRYRHEGPKATKVGRALLWKLSDVDAWLEGRPS